MKTRSRHPKGVERRAAGVEFIKKHQHRGTSQEAIIRRPSSCFHCGKLAKQPIERAANRIKIESRCLMPICARDVFAPELSARSGTKCDSGRAFALAPDPIISAIAQFEFPFCFRREKLLLYRRVSWRIYQHKGM